MAGIAIVIDLWRKNRSFSSPDSLQALHSYGLFSATTAVSAAAVSVATGYPFGFKDLFSNFRIPVAHCDAGTSLSEDYISRLQSVSGKIFANDAITYSPKEYNIQLKPLFSAFEWQALALTSLRSFLIFYLPLLEPHARTEEEDDEDFLEDKEEEKKVDLVVPLKKSMKQIARETTVVTTRRILERMAVHYVSQRMAWKLLKDVPKSAARKAARQMPTTVYFFCVTRTTLRGHFLGVAASWLVQVGIEIYRFFSAIASPSEDEENIDREEQVELLRKKVSIATIRCSSSLVFAAIGAGICATLFRPSGGQWIGCAVGDLAGPSIVALCFPKFFQTDI